jgi:hypothetical protein
MGRIAALIKPHDLTYMLLDWQVWWPASHRKPKADPWSIRKQRRY